MYTSTLVAHRLKATVAKPLEPCAYQAKPRINTPGLSFFGGCVIYLDDRIGSGELKYFFLPEEVTVTRLDYADCYFMGNGPDGPVSIGIERKTVGDLLGSVKSGRFQGRQLPGMLTSYNYVYLLLEGIYRSHPHNKHIERLWHGKWQRLHGNSAPKMSFLINLLNTIGVLCGVQVRMAADDRETADAIKNIFEWWQKPWESHHSHVGFQLIPAVQANLEGPPSTFQKMVKELPGISWIRSQVVEEHFGKMQHVLEATEEDWCKVPGIGLATAKKIRAALEDI